MNAGITGHREFANIADEQWARNALFSALREHKVTYGFTCLAEGADQLFADVLVHLSVPYTTIIPCGDYTSTFSSDEGRMTFERLLKLSNKQHTLAFSQPSDEAFLAAGQEVVQRCDILFAIWDGAPAKGKGGTAEVVAYSKQLGKQLMHANPLARTVIVSC